MHILERAGEKSILPQVAAPPVHLVDVLRVAEMRSADGLGQRGFVLRCADDMDVVGHQAVGVNGESEGLTLLAKDFEVGSPIVGHEEHVLAVVAALGNVVGYARKNDSRNAWHEPTLPRDP